jgi:hypothetical protein
MTKSKQKDLKLEKDDDDDFDVFNTFHCLIYDTKFYDICLLSLYFLQRKTCKVFATTVISRVTTLIEICLKNCFTTEKFKLNLQKH